MNPITFDKKAEKTRRFVRREDLPIPEGTASPDHGKRPIGLCPVCIHSHGCTFPREADTPVRHCEEFEGETIAVTTAAPAPAPAAARTSELRGLCRNCQHAESCTFPKSEAGVWFCEEYE